MMPGTDPVRTMIARARQHPEHCAFCGTKKDRDIDLIAFDETPAMRPEVAEPSIPICDRCYERFQIFAGDQALIIPGSQR